MPKPLLQSDALTHPRKSKSQAPLSDQIVLVTGASRGLGRAIAFEIAQKGARIAITYLKEKAAAEEVIREIQQLGGEAVAYRADAKNLQEIKNAIEQTKTRYGGLTALVNNAGIIRDKPLMLMTEQDWHDVIDTNLTGVFNSCRVAIVDFMKQKQGRIINITSVAGLIGAARQVNYAASKAGIIGFTRALAKEVAAYGVTVNAVAPGYISAGMTTNLNEKLYEEFVKQIPVGRFGKPDEIAGAVTYLLSGAASYITGQVMVIDGGLTI